MRHLCSSRLLALPTVLVIVLAGACASAPRLPAVVAHTNVETPAPTPTLERKPIFMFSIQREGLPKSFLHGSVHLLRHKADAQSQATNRAFEDADTLVVEVDITAISEQAIAAESLKLGLYPLDDELTAHLSPERWQKIAAALPTLGLDPAAVIRMKPWFLSLLIEMQSLQKDGYSADNGVDLGFLKRAHDPKHPKAIAELESAQSQLQSLANIPEAAQLLMLEDAIAQSDNGLFERLMSAWTQGDVATLESAMFEQLKTTPETAPMYEAMFFKRNRQMTARMTEMLNTGKRLFVVIGAGHLVGEQGIPALLRAQGFTIEQVFVDTAPISTAPDFLANE